MGWAARLNHRQGSTKKLRSKRELEFGRCFPGERVRMSDRQYTADDNGSLRLTIVRRQKQAAA